MKKEKLLNEYVNFPCLTSPTIEKVCVTRKSALDAMEKHAIEFGEYIEKNTYPAGGGKFYHTQYLNNPKLKKAVTVKQLYKRFNSEK